MQSLFKYSFILKILPNCVTSVLDLLFLMSLCYNNIDGTSKASSEVDITALFDEMVASKTYQVFDDFHKNLLEFQRLTFTSYEVNYCQTAGRAKYAMPAEAKYKYVSYRCIHRHRPLTGKRVGHR